ncbi:MAG: NAD(P)-binding domain-containing protein [Chloroflexota bacterium]
MSPAEVAAKAQSSLLVSSDTPDVVDVVLGKNGVIEGIRPGTLLIDCSTISPKTTREDSGSVSGKTG